MGEGQELRDDALCNEIPQEEQEEAEGMTLEEKCKAAVAGKIKPSVNLLEKAIGTLWELDPQPDGSVQFKHYIPPTVGDDDFKEDCFALRAQIEETKGQTMLMIHNHPALTGVFTEHQTVEPQRIEMTTNLMLAYRHLEDARMRCGKAIQAFDGGKSCYPR